MVVETPTCHSCCPPPLRFPLVLKPGRACGNRVSHKLVLLLEHSSETGVSSIVDAVRENEQKRRQLQEDYEKQKAKFEAEKAILWAATQEGMRALQPDRVTVAAKALSVARACFEDAITYANERELRGAPIGKFQMIQSDIAQRNR